MSQIMQVVRRSAQHPQVKNVLQKLPTSPTKSPTSPQVKNFHTSKHAKVEADMPRLEHCEISPNAPYSPGPRRSSDSKSFTIKKKLFSDTPSAISSSMKEESVISTIAKNTSAKHTEFVGECTKVLGGQHPTPSQQIWAMLFGPTALFPAQGGVSTLDMVTHSALVEGKGAIASLAELGKLLRCYTADIALTTSNFQVVKHAVIIGGDAVMTGVSNLVKLITGCVFITAYAQGKEEEEIQLPKINFVVDNDSTEITYEKSGDTIIIRGNPKDLQALNLKAQEQYEEATSILKNPGPEDDGPITLMATLLPTAHAEAQKIGGGDELYKEDFHPLNWDDEAGIFPLSHDHTHTENHEENHKVSLSGEEKPFEVPHWVLMSGVG